MLGLETALSSVNQTMVQTGLLSWEQLVDRMSAKPAEIGRYADHGKALEKGAPAHLTVINPTALNRVDRDRVSSRSRNTPFHGMELQGLVTATIYGGKLTFKAVQS
jgi:dihydroorotase